MFATALLQHYSTKIITVHHITISLIYHHLYQNLPVV